MNARQHTANTEFEGPEEKKYRPGGLCASCRHAEHCGLCRTSNVYFCETFEMVPPSALQVVPESPPDPEQTGDLHGLCMNCTRHESCLLPKPPGGIWHCQDYE